MLHARSLCLALIPACAVWLVTAACTGGDLDVASEMPPVIGAAGDAADRTCRVILREMRSLAEGYVDVDTAVLGNGGPGVLFSTNGTTFTQAPVTTTVAGAPAGYQRFRFALPVSGTPLEVTLIPFVTVDGGRLFDHNRNNGDLDNYVLHRDEGYTVALDADSCPAKGACDVPGVALQRAFAGIEVSYPTSIRQAPGDSTRVFVVEKGGTIKVFASSTDATTASVFLDIESRTYRTATGEMGWEEGMYDIAFDPAFPSVPRAYVTYVSGQGTDMKWRLSRFSSSNGGLTLNPASEKILIELQKPGETHNGGSLAFGPDGFLYVSIGDGGGVLDPHDNAQNKSSLFGKILRIDIHGGGSVGYASPPDNPFASNGQGRPEIYAYGIRNPWRMSFDRQTGELWEAEVGQDAREEVNLVVKGGNYGYPNREAKRCTGKGSCTGAFIDPAFEIFHTNQQVPAGAAVGNSVTGGFVYRGTALPELRGYYVFGDFITGVIWGYRKGTANPVELTATGQSIAAFGEGIDGELYLLHHQAVGKIFKLVEGSCRVPRPRDGRFYAFLSRDGVASQDDALSYYQSILPGVDLSSYTLATWTAQRMAGPTVSSLFRNTADLGFWRQMSCSTTLDRGVGGCKVTNWADEADVTNPAKANLGTVTMDISPEGYTRFYVFGPDGRLSPGAVLDGEGQKFAPMLCTPCHGGRWTGPGADPDLGSIFREFEPSLLQRRSGITAAQAEAEWYALNQAVLSANLALRSEAEGAPSDFNRWRTNIVEYIDHDIYATESPPVSRNVSDPFHVPPSWLTGATAALRAAKSQLYSKVVIRYCEQCHRTNTKDFSDYTNFESLAAQQNGTSLLVAYTTGDPTHLEDRALAFMPQSQLMFNHLNADTEAQSAIQQWLQVVANPGGACNVTFRSNGPSWTHVGQDVWITGSIAQLGNWSPVAGLKLSGAAFPVWQGSIALPPGAVLEYKATVIDSQTGAVTWEGGANHQVTIPTGSACPTTFTTNWTNP